MRKRNLLIISGSVFACGTLVCVVFLVLSFATRLGGSAVPVAPAYVPTALPAAPTSAPAGPVESPLPLTPAAVELTPLPTRVMVIPTKTSLMEMKERRLAVLEWPASIHVGDSDVLTLTLQVDQAGKLTPTAQISGHEVTGTPVFIPGLYDTYNLVAAARLDLAGVEISPQGMVSQPMRPGQAVFFSWSISPSQLGKYRGTLWLYLNLVPKSGGEPDQLTLLAPQIQIESVSVFGLPGPVARWGGVAGTSLSFVFGFPFIESLLRKTWKWMRAK